MNFIKNDTENVMNCYEEEMRVIFPLTTVLYAIPESLEPVWCTTPSLVLFRGPLKQEKKLESFFIDAAHPLKPV